LSFYEEVGVGVLKIEESESELLCTESTALLNNIVKKYVDTRKKICTTVYSKGTGGTVDAWGLGNVPGEASTSAFTWSVLMCFSQREL
jgi:hypothetical protein